MPASKMAAKVGVSRQRVSQVLAELGYPRRVAVPIAKGAREEYQCWHNMIARCNDANHKAFKHYGGRGITVCARWMNSFRDFLSDMGRRPTPRHSLDRIDNNGIYTPSNCRWATSIEQALNRRAADRTPVDIARKVWTVRSLTAIDKLAHPDMRGWTAATAYAVIGPTGVRNGLPRGLERNGRKVGFDLSKAIRHLRDYRNVSAAAKHVGTNRQNLIYHINKSPELRRLVTKRK